MKQKAGGDRFFHCDFNQGQELGEWHFESGTHEVDVQFTLDRERDAVLLVDHNNKALVREYVLDGQTYALDWAQSETAYIGAWGLRQGFRHRLAAGTHRARLSCAVSPDIPAPWTADLSVTLMFPEAVPAPAAPVADRLVAVPPPPDFPAPLADVSLDGYRQGVGGGQVSIGRFGYTKGDGLLDCAMTTLGGVNRMHLFGHPLYKKTTRWQYSLLPKGIDPKTRYRGSFLPAENGVAGDEIAINYLGCSWKTVLPRLSGGAVKFGCAYSLASAGIMVETDDDQLSLGELDYAGNYTRVLLPLERGMTVRDISSADTAYDRRRDGELQANWLLLFGATAFPDIPLQVVMTRKPERVALTRRGGGLSGADIMTDGPFGTGFVVSPFGIESFVPGETASDAFAADAASRCAFWSRAVLAYPVDAEEFYKVDADAERVSIVQKFKHRLFADEWGTEPLRTAPLPPALDFSLDLAGFASDPTAADFRFPTKYGYLKGVVNADRAAYSLPFLPERRRINFRPAGDDRIADELADGFEDYWQFMEQFAPDEFPLSPYCASYLERYRFVRSMLNYLREPRRTELLGKLRANLPLAADPDRSFQLLCGVPFEKLTGSGADAATVAKLFKDKGVMRKTFYNWYERTEPFTGQTYKLSYVNCCVAHNLESGSKDIVERQLAATPMVEVDWGTALSLNAISLSALAVDGWESLRANWDTLRAGFKYYHLYQDWACMCASYTESGVSWVEGANYNAFIGFCRMAAALGQEDDLALGRYLGAKQGALRLAVFRSSYRYFPKFFRRSPWWISKCFHNEVEPEAAFLNAPDPGPEGESFRQQGFFNLATEGQYPETYMLFLKHIPEEFMDAWRVYRSAPVDFDVVGPYCQIECHAGYLLSLVLEGGVTERELEAEIAHADRAGIMVRDWFGLHYPVRYLPRNCYQSYLKSILVAKDYPLWLEHWQGLELKDAVYDAARRVATVEVTASKAGARLECGAVRKPSAATLDGRPLPFEFIPGKNRLVLAPQAPGTLSLEF